MVVVYLYSQIMPYQTVVYSALSKVGVEVHAFENKDVFLTPYEKPIIENVKYYLMNNFTKNQLLEKVKSLRPDILVVCGWNNTKYKYVARFFKSRTTIPVISPIDSQYLGTIKQKIGFVIAPIYVKRLFSHIWVPGVRQYYFAKKMGYDDQHIIMNSLTADTRLFLNASIQKKEREYPKRILFVGRYNKVKGLDILLNAWNSIRDKKGWTLTLVGNGPLKDELNKSSNIEVLDFQHQTELVKIAENSGLFVLPSHYEPWALVLQEFAAAGLPIICSDACGASPHCVVNGYNGYTFKTGDSNDLKQRLETVIGMHDDKLLELALNSRQLSQFVTPEISAASLIGVLK